MLPYGHCEDKIDFVRQKELKAGNPNNSIELFYFKSQTDDILRIHFASVPNNSQFMQF